MQVKENMTYNKTTKHIKEFFLNLKNYTFYKEVEKTKQLLLPTNEVAGR